VWRLGILTGGTPDQLISAIYQENITFLTKLPGIGKKTAQRMILDLKDKLDGLGGACPMQTGTVRLAAEVRRRKDDGALPWEEARGRPEGAGLYR
jgi:Holliday junction DNA helicase RuvA